MTREWELGQAIHLFEAVLAERERLLGGRAPPNHDRPPQPGPRVRVEPMIARQGDLPRPQGIPGTRSWGRIRRRVDHPNARRSRHARPPPPSRGVEPPGRSVTRLGL